MHISNNPIASLFQQMQAMASGGSVSASFGAQLTGQNLPTITAGAAFTSSQAPSPLSFAPSSQFASHVLSALLGAQQGPPSARAVVAPADSAGETSSSDSAGDASTTPGSFKVSVAV